MAGPRSGSGLTRIDLLPAMRGHIVFPRIAQEAAAEGVSPLLFALTFFLICLAIGIFAVLGGVGGGIVFTPLMLGFTNIDSFVVRTTGIFIAMTGALIASRPYLRKGMANIRVLFVAAVPYSVFAIIGALLAGYIHKATGPVGEAVIRGALGLIVIGVAILTLGTPSRSPWRRRNSR